MSLAVPLAQSFYITGGTLPGTAECYVERKADTDIHEGILAGDYVYVLDSRQMGKSSLCVRTLRKLKEAGFQTAFVDLTKFGVRNLTPDQWFLAMLREVGRELGLVPSLVEYWRENSDVPPVRRFFGAIQDRVLDQISGRVAIFIDEIDVTRSLPFDTDEFFAGIRQCYIGRATDPRLSRLTFSLIGTATPAELITDTRVSPFNIGYRVDLHDFCFDEAIVLARSLPGDGQVLLRRILYWTGGHPYLTQKLCQVVAGQTVSRIDEVCRALFLGRQARETDDNFAFVRNRLLRNDVDLAALLEVYGKVRSGKVVLDEETNPLCAVLKMSGVVRVENGRLRVRNRIYSEVFSGQWVRENLPDGESRRQMMAFRKGVIRTTAIAASVCLAVGGLALYGFSQARLARHALDSAKQLTQNLRRSQSNLESSLSETKKALALAESRRLTAESAEGQAKLSATEASEQRTLANVAAGNAAHEAVLARAATHLADERLSSSLVAQGTQDLEAGDPAAAIKPLLTAMRLDTSDVFRSRMDRNRLGYALDSASRLRQVWSGGGPMLDAQLLDNGRTVLIGNADGSIRVCDAESGRVKASPISHPGLTTYAVSKDHRHVLTGSRNGDVRWWDLASGRLLRVWRGKVSIHRVGLSDDATVAAIAQDQDHEYTNYFMWDLTSNKGPAHFDKSLGFAATNGLVFSPNGKRILTFCGNFMAWSFDLGDGNGSRNIGQCFAASQAQFVDGGSAFLINGADENGPATFAQGAVQLWSLTGQCLVRYQLATRQDGYGRAFRLSADGQTLMVATSAGNLQQFDFKTGQRKGLKIHCESEIFDADLSPDGDTVAVAGGDGSVRVWSFLTGERVGPILWHGSIVNKVRFVGSGSELLTCSNDGTARLWKVDPTGLAETRSPPSLTGRVCAHWAITGDLVAYDANETWRWSQAKGWRRLLPAYRFMETSVLPQPLRRGIFVCQGGLRVYDFEKEVFITSLIKSRPSFSLQSARYGLSSSQRYLFAEDRERHFKIWDLDRQGFQVSEFVVPERTFMGAEGSGPEGYRDHRCALRFSPDDNRILTDGEGGSIDLWITRSGAHVARLAKNNDLIRDDFNADGSMVLMTTYAHSPAGFFLDMYRVADGNTAMPRRFFVNDMASGFTGAGQDSRIVEVAAKDPIGWSKIDGLYRRPPISVSTSLRDPVGSGSDASYIARGNRSASIVFHSWTRRLYDVRTQRAISPRLSSEFPLTSAFSDDGRYFAVSTNTQAYVYDLSGQGRLVGPMFTGNRSLIGFTPDSSLLWTRTDHKMTFWDPRSGEQVCFGGQPGFFSPNFRPDGKWFALEFDNSVVVRRMPETRLTNKQMELAAQTCSREQLSTLDQAKWAALHR